MVALTHLAYSMGTLEGARSKDASTQGAINAIHDWEYQRRSWTSVLAGARLLKRDSFVLLDLF